MYAPQLIQYTPVQYNASLSSRVQSFCTIMRVAAGIEDCPAADRFCWKLLAVLLQHNK